jgi:hypothetical protein
VFLQEKPRRRPGDGADRQDLEPADPVGPRGQVPQVFPEKGQEAEERTQVKRDVEGEARILPAQIPRQEREVRRTRDRQELRQALDDPENGGLEQRHGFFRKRPRGT